MKDLKLSTELASVVLGLNVVYIESCEHRDNIIGIWTDMNTKPIKEINIYEFTYKCKEWILNQKNKDCFYIADQFSLNIESQMGVIKYFWCVLLKNNSRISPEFKADSEIEAILKACNWVLELENENA